MRILTCIAAIYFVLIDGAMSQLNSTLRAQTALKRWSDEIYHLYVWDTITGWVPVCRDNAFWVSNGAFRERYCDEKDYKERQFNRLRFNVSHAVYEYQCTGQEERIDDCNTTKLYYHQHCHSIVILPCAYYNLFYNLWPLIFFAAVIVADTVSVCLLIRFIVSTPKRKRRVTIYAIT